MFLKGRKAHFESIKKFKTWSYKIKGLVSAGLRKVHKRKFSSKLKSPFSNFWYSLIAKFQTVGTNLYD